MKRFKIATLVIMLALFAPACSPAPASATPTADPVAVLKAFEEAQNAGDIDAAMVLVADDAVMDRGPYGVLTGTADIREVLEIEMSKQLKFESSNFRVSGDTVTYDWKVTNLSGQVFEGTSVAIVQDGKIKSDR